MNVSQSSADSVMSYLPALPIISRKAAPLSSSLALFTTHKCWEGCICFHKCNCCCLTTAACLHFGPFVKAIHAHPQHFHDPCLHRAHSPISFYLPKSPNKIMPRSATMEKECKQSSFNPCTHI